MERPAPPRLTELRKLVREKGWRASVALFLAEWNRSQVRRIFTAVLAVWVAGGVALHLAEPDNPAFATLYESLWNVWLTLFSGMNTPPNSVLGRAVAFVVLVAGVAFAGLFTASIASILIERTLRRKEVSSLEMSDHLFWDAVAEIPPLPGLEPRRGKTRRLYDEVHVIVRRDSVPLFTHCVLRSDGIELRIPFAAVQVRAFDLPARMDWVSPRRLRRRDIR